MDLEPSPEQRELLDAVHAVLERECPTGLARGIAEGGAAPGQPWKSARELGWTAIDVPEDCGGLGLGFDHLGLVVEQHGRFLAPGPFVATVTHFLPLLREAGDAAQRERFVAAAAAGELTGALAVDQTLAAEHGVGDALRAQPKGDAWLLEGRRAFVLDGSSASELAVAARVERGDGVGLFVVPRSAVRVEPVVALDGTRPLAHLAFDAVRVEAERVLGVPGECARALGRALEEATVATALETVGACDALLDLSLGHARSRRQFDQPIGAFQAIQHKCADMLVDLEKARATAYFAMVAIREDDPRRTLAASMAKSAAGDCQARICAEAVQIHGGMGFTWEADVHLFVKRARTGEALFGTAAQHRQRVAALLGF